MLMKTFIEHLVGIEDVECAATYRAAVKDGKAVITLRQGSR